MFYNYYLQDWNNLAFLQQLKDLWVLVGFYEFKMPDFFFLLQAMFSIELT